MSFLSERIRKRVDAKFTSRHRGKDGCKPGFAEVEKEFEKEDRNKPSRSSTHNTHSTRTLRVTDIISQLKLADTGVNDDHRYVLQNIPRTNFPKLSPIYIVGPKGSGKTYMIAALLQYIFREKVARRMFYIYAESIDTTILRAVPKSRMYSIPKAIAAGFISKYLSKKSKVCSCSRFIASLQSFGGLDGTLPGSSQVCFRNTTIDDLDGTPVYSDQLLDSIIKRKQMVSTVELHDYCTRVLNKYSNRKSVVIKVADAAFNVGSITPDDYDLFVIDDIAQFYDLFGSTRANSDVYQYFTVTRQNQTNFILAGQDLMQLPKMFREQLGALVVLYGTNLDKLKEFRMSKAVIDEIGSKWKTLNTHEGILYNFDTREMETIRHGSDS